MLYTRLFDGGLRDFSKDYKVPIIGFANALVTALKQMTNIKKLVDEDENIFSASDYVENYDIYNKRGSVHKPYFKMSLEEKIEHDMDFIENDDKSVDMYLRNPGGYITNYTCGYISIVDNKLTVDLNRLDNQYKHIAVDYGTSENKVITALIKIVKNRFNFKDAELI